MSDTPASPSTAAVAAEAALFHEIARRLDGGLPPFVRRVGFRFGEDSTGAPAVWITVVTDDDLRPSEQKIADLHRFTSDVRMEILHSDTERWPYVEIVTE